MFWIYKYLSLKPCSLYVLIATAVLTFLFGFQGEISPVSSPWIFS